MVNFEKYKWCSWAWNTTPSANDSGSGFRWTFYLRPYPPGQATLPFCPKNFKLILYWLDFLPGIVPVAQEDAIALGSTYLVPTQVLTLLDAWPITCLWTCPVHMILSHFYGYDIGQYTMQTKGSTQTKDPKDTQHKPHKNKRSPKIPQRYPTDTTPQILPHRDPTETIGPHTKERHQCHK